MHEMSKEFPRIEAFRTQLQKLGGDFVCNTQMPDTVVSVRFLGPFHGQTVLWQMTLATLKYYGATDFSDASAKSPLRPFIQINDGREGVHVLKVGLDLETIDEPVIKKTIIMMRNFKRLAIGRIEFGNMHT